MVEKFAQNGIFFSVENNSTLFNKLKMYASQTNVSSATSSRYAVAMKSARAKKKTRDLSQIKVRLASNSQSVLIDLVKTVRNHHCDANFMFKELSHTFPQAKCPPLAVTSMSVDDYYTTSNIVAKDYSAMFDIENAVNTNLTMMAEELSIAETEKRVRG